RLNYLMIGLGFGYITIGVTIESFKRVRNKLRRSMSQGKFPRLGLSHNYTFKTKKSEGVVVDNINKESSIRNDDDEEESCPICLYHIQIDDFGYVSLRDCMHNFHHDCIRKWLLKSTRCPLCRSSVIRKHRSYILNTMCHSPHYI
ncbi:hypothetical protein EUTSA_v10022133mg, partial [Eutrema salsugineum]